MTADPLILSGGSIFDGTCLLSDHVARIENGRVAALLPDTSADAGDRIDLGGDILSLGYADLQVNGGGGFMLNDDPSIAVLRRMATAHRRLGTVAFLPTLITDTREKTQAAIAAVRDAIAQGIPEIAGLHLEGPHLSVARKGAHDPDLIRPMTDSDLADLLRAAESLPALIVTLAPESVTPQQVRRLADAGACVSLGHSDATYDTCLTYAEAGASMVTHLFNAMSQLGSRAPGLVGAALNDGRLSAGLIADGLHVHPATIVAALEAKAGPGELFLVSDSMAPAGTDLATFELGGRAITRSDGRLTLGDGTLAGADLDLTTAVRIMVEQVGVPLSAALRAATFTPRCLLPAYAGLSGIVGCQINDLIRITPDLRHASPVTP